MALENKEEVEMTQVASKLEDDLSAQQNTTDGGSPAHPDTREEQTQDPDQIIRSRSSSISSFSHQLDEPNQESDKESSDSNVSNISTDVLNTLTFFRPDFAQSYRTPEYFSALVQEHLSAAPRSKSERMQHATELSFLVSISADYIFWEARNEFQDIEKKGTTDHEQLCRIRSLFKLDPLSIFRRIPSISSSASSSHLGSLPGYQNLNAPDKAVVMEEIALQRTWWSRSRSQSRPSSVSAQDDDLNLGYNNADKNGEKHGGQEGQDFDARAPRSRRVASRFWQLLRVMKSYGIKVAEQIFGLIIGVIGVVLFGLGMVIHHYVEAVRGLIMPLLSRWRRR